MAQRREQAPDRTEARHQLQYLAPPRLPRMLAAEASEISLAPAPLEAQEAQPPTETSILPGRPAAPLLVLP